MRILTIFFLALTISCSTFVLPQTGEMLADLGLPIDAGSALEKSTEGC